MQKTSAISEFLFQSKKEELESLIKEDKFFEAFSIIKQLKKDYEGNERVTELIAGTMFYILSENADMRDLDILQYIFNKAEDCFFNPYICTYVLGILLILNTKTDEKVITEVGRRMMKMKPCLMRTVLHQLPETIHHTELKHHFESKLETPKDWWNRILEKK